MTRTTRLLVASILVLQPSCQLVTDFSRSDGERAAGGKDLGGGDSGGTEAGGAGGRSSNKTSAMGGTAASATTATGGTSSIGGTSSDATGESGGTGGVLNSVPDTLAGTGGTGGTATTTTIPRAFRAGPCVVATAPDVTEVLARGATQIYRRPVGGTEPSVWSALPDLDASIIDNRSDVDCIYDGDAIHLVASGTNPLGAILHATGTGTDYNPFVRELADRVIDPSPAIWTHQRTSLFFAATVYRSLLVGRFESGVFSDWKAPYDGPNDFIASSPDIAVRGSGGWTTTIIAGYDQDGFLNAHYYLESSAPAYWYDSVLFAKAPPGSTFAFSPSVCVGQYQGMNTTYFAATTNDHKLWLQKASGLETSTLETEWHKVSDDAYSAPDCVVNNYGSDVNIVARSQQDTILLHKGTGKGSSWIATDLGRY